MSGIQATASVYRPFIALGYTCGDVLRDKGFAVDTMELDIRDTTTDAIVQAAEELIAEGSCMHLTITQIAKRAGVARQTYYRRFADIPAVLQAITARIVDELAELDTRGWEPGGDATERISLVFVVLDKHRPLLKSLLNDGRLPGFMFLFWDDFHGRYLYPNLQPDESLRKLSRFTAGGLVPFIQDWIADENPKSPEEMAKEYRTIVMQSLEILFP